MTEFYVLLSKLEHKGKLYVKKLIPIMAVQMDKEFSVDTKEGIMTGKAGDYLLRGIKGELYPCDKEIFEESYEKYKGK